MQRYFSTSSLEPSTADSRDSAVVVAQQTAESFATLNDACGLADVTTRINQIVVEPLMISLGVLVSLELGQSFSQRGFTEEHHAVERFLLEASHESLHVRIQIGRGDGKHVCSDTFSFQRGSEFFRKLGVPIVHHNRRLPLSIHRLIEEVFRLFHHPRGVGMLGRWGNDHFASH